MDKKVSNLKIITIFASMRVLKYIGNTVLGLLAFAGIIALTGILAAAAYKCFMLGFNLV